MWYTASWYRAFFNSNILICALNVCKILGIGNQISSTFAVFIGVSVCKMMQDDARWCKTMQDNARWCKPMQDDARWCVFSEIKRNGLFHTLHYGTELEFWLPKLDAKLAAPVLARLDLHCFQVILAWVSLCAWYKLCRVNRQWSRWLRASPTFQSVVSDARWAKDPEMLSIQREVRANEEWSFKHRILTGSILQGLSVHRSKCSEKGVIRAIMLRLSALMEPYFLCTTKKAESSF